MAPPRPLEDTELAAKPEDPTSAELAARPATKGVEGAGGGPTGSSAEPVTAHGPSADSLTPARATTAREVKATRDEVTEAGGGKITADGRGRTVNVVGLLDSSGRPDEHAQQVGAAITDPDTGIAPKADVRVSGTATSGGPEQRTPEDLVRDTKAWSGTVDLKATAAQVEAAEKAVAAKKGTADDVATLALAGTAATMAAMRAGEYVDGSALDPFATANRITGGRGAEIMPAIHRQLNDPGASPVAQAARQAVDGWAASDPKDLIKGTAKDAARAIHGYADGLQATRNPDPSKPAFTNISNEVTPALTRNLAQASFLSPQFREQNGLSPLGTPAKPGDPGQAKEDEKAKALFDQRADQIAPATEKAWSEDEGVAAAQARFDGIAREKLEKENMATIVAAGNQGRHSASRNFLATEHVTSAATTTDFGEPFHPKDNTPAAFTSEQADIAAPGLGFDSAGQPLPGTSYAAPYVAGAAALVSQQRPELSANEVMGLLKATAQPAAGPLASRAGAGIVDIPAAVRAPMAVSRSASPSGPPRESTHETL